MRGPATIEPWLTPSQMQRWVDAAGDVATYRRRLAIVLTARGPFHAHVVARLLGVSAEAVGQWVRRYNAAGPAAFDGVGRGGRRDSYLSLAQERAVLRALTQRAAAGRILTAKHVLPALR